MALNRNFVVVMCGNNKLTIPLIVDDSSPLISYSPAGAWVDTPDGDSLVQQYSGQSLHSSAIKDANATLRFNGTGVWFFGGKRSNYGAFSLEVDGVVVSSGSALASSSSTQQLLAGVGSLGMGEHEAVLTNSGTGTVDLDSILIESEVGSTRCVSVVYTLTPYTQSINSGSVSYAIIEDGGANITYSGSDWNSSDDSMFTNSSTQ